MADKPQDGEPGTVAVTVEQKPGKGTYKPEAAAKEPRLRIHDLGVTYVDRQGQQTEAVHEITLDILDKPGCGEIVVFLGSSGCGKSTILKAVAGILPPTRGEIAVDGQPVVGVGRDRGMVFQAYTSFGWLTVRDNVEYGLRLAGVPAEERKQKALEYVEAVG